MRESKKTQAAILALLIVCALFILRAVAVGAYQIRMSDAIYVYQLDCMRRDLHPLVWQEDKESFEDTYRRWWDWSDHHILQEDKYKIIKPYIQRESWTVAAGKYLEG